MKISIIICANSPDHVFEGCLQSVRKQSRQADEIIVMDIGNGGSRKELVQSLFETNCDYHYHEKEKRCHVETARCRNQAVKIATGDILVFLDDSIILPYEHLQKTELLFQSNAIHACVFLNRYLSRSVTESDTDLSNICFIDWQHLVKMDYPAIRDKHLIRAKYPWGETNLLCYCVQSSYFIASGGFDEQIAIYAGSDADLIFKLHCNGARIVYPPEMVVYVQQKDQYPAVRWRASGGEYTAYRTRDPRAMEWFAIKTLGKRIIDYNRYHPGKCMLSRCGTHRLSTKFHESDVEMALILLIDCVPDASKIAQISEIAKQTIPVYIVSLLSEKSLVIEELMQVVVGSNAIFCHWQKKEAWETVCKLLKTSMLVLQTSKNKCLTDYIEAQKSKWIAFKEKLEAEIMNELDYEIAAHYCIIKRVSQNLNEVFEKASQIITSMQSCNMNIKQWNFNSFLYQHQPGFSLPPRTISFRLTYVCNLRCKMCGQWGINGIYKNKNTDFLKQHMSIELLMQTVDETAALCPGMYYIWGGEPMLHPDYIKLIQYIKRKGIYCTTTTNGMFLKKYARMLCEIGTEFIRISIDGTEHIHNSIRGNPNCYQTVMEGIKEITRIKKELHTVYPILECDSVIIKDNYRFIEEYIEEISAIEGINSINFSHPIYSNTEVGNRQSMEYQKEFGMIASAWNGFSTDEEQLDTEELIKIIARIQKKKYRVPINFDPPMRTLDDIRLHYTDIEKLYSKRFCTVPWIWAEIHPDGKVSFCEDFCDYYIGDLHESKFFDIWNGEAAQKYRKVLLRRNQFPICSYCGLLCHDADF